MNNIAGMSAQTLQRLAPYIERVAGRDIPPPRANGKETEDERLDRIALNKIRRAVLSYNLPTTQADKDAFTQSVAERRQQQLANGEGIGSPSSWISQNGVWSRVHGGNQEFINLFHQAKLDMASQVWVRFNELKASGGLQVNSSGVDETV